GDAERDRPSRGRPGAARSANHRRARAGAGRDRRRPDRLGVVTGAAFLDRDGTIVFDPGYLNDPADVRLLPRAADGVRRLPAAGLRVVVVTNQSGIARKLVSADQYRRVTERIDQLLAAEGARLDATYHCPHHPDISGPCACRKPGLLLYREAADR